MTETESEWKCPVCEESARGNYPEPPFCGVCAGDNGRDVQMRRIPLTALGEPEDE